MSRDKNIPGPRPPIRRSSSSSTNVKQTGTKPLCPEPTDVNKLISMLALHLCKRTLFMDTTVKIGLYLVAVTLGSILTDIVPLPRTYFGDKNNFFNQTFVKWGWGWTLSILFCFMASVSWVITCGDMKGVRRHLARLVISTAWWFVCVRFFSMVDHLTGICTATEYRQRGPCRSAGYKWIGFDISGHTFLLIHCLLTISEEVKSFKGWEKIAEIIKTEEEAPKKMKISDVTFLKKQYTLLTPGIKILFGLLAILSLLWEVMLIATILYFHNMPQKLLGALFAIIVWFLSYRLIYKSDWSPGLPGHCTFIYNK